MDETYKPTGKTATERQSYMNEVDEFESKLEGNAPGPRAQVSFGGVKESSGT